MKTIRELNKDLKNKTISAKELTQEYLTKIKNYNQKINAFIHLDEELSLKEALKADEMLKNGNDTILTGIPIAYKDLFCQQDWLTTAASKILDTFVSPYTATVVEKLSNSGMVPIGRTNMDEFAMGSTNENSYYGKVLNPWNLEHVPGGSSGGSAAAVAAGLIPASLGSDTGGSIRQPASHCGITGIKPTYGRVSRFGMAAYASSFDQAGPMAQNAEDCALILNHMSGFDEKDSTSVDRKVEDFSINLNDSIKGLTIGIPKEYINTDLDKDVHQAIENTKNILQKMGAKVVEISLSNTDLSIPAYYILTSAEASTNLSRYDGVRYGYRTKDYSSLEEMYEKTRSEGFGNEVKRRIMIGTYVLSHGYYDAYYVKAQKLRRIVVEDYKKAFLNCDVILAPITATPAPKIGNLTTDPVKMYLSDIFTISLNLAGLPGISIPANISKDGLPIGIQFIGNYFAESKILNLAHQVQQETDWHKKQPAYYAK